eukprot:4896113-Pyramimonas_sp.AAC.1
MRATSDPQAWPEDLEEEEGTLRGALEAFYVAWDPYLGTNEEWAPDVVGTTRRRLRADPRLRHTSPLPLPPLLRPLQSCSRTHNVT